ncbi:ubiquitin-conjugating enzyme E2 D3-like [Saccopteryx bilineata]|uniref:ubiquitin-conjugating enzyme E2 D3-like n=1 Tax=Saccopteryx bilineata TaxID=59482 RepID=UPI00338DD110
MAHPEAKAVRRLTKELLDMSRNPPEHYSVGPVGDNMLEWEGNIVGPKDSPYERGVFIIKMNFPWDYPISPPKITFTTPIYHPNVDKYGAVSMDLLWLGWSLMITISQILQSVRSLLCQPVLDDMTYVEIGGLYLEDRVKFHSKARELTDKYAM